MRWELSEEQADFRSVLADWLADRCGIGTLRGWLDAGDLGTFEDAFEKTPQVPPLPAEESSGCVSAFRMASCLMMIPL